MVFLYAQIQIVDGKNIADFIDPEIMQRLEELEKEEEERIETFENEMEEDDQIPELTIEQRKIVKAIRDKKKIIIQQHQENKGRNSSSIPRRFQNSEVITIIC